MTDITTILNEMRTIPSVGDFDRVRTTKPNGDAAVYQLLMTAANLHTSIATVLQGAGNSRAGYHKALADKLRLEANQNIIGK
jgi:hypothetical protein